MARLSTHVLDTARGRPAAGVLIELAMWRDGARHSIKTLATNSDGRTDEPLLPGDILETGVYELTFHAGDYYRRAGIELPEPPFLDEVVIRFGVADASGHYHVPLLLTPYGYCTYRGS